MFVHADCSLDELSALRFGQLTRLDLVESPIGGVGPRLSGITDAIAGLPWLEVLDASHMCQHFSIFPADVAAIGRLPCLKEIRLVNSLLAGKNTDATAVQQALHAQRACPHISWVVYDEDLGASSTLSLNQRSVLGFVW